MIIKIVWSWEDFKTLSKKTRESLDELGLSSFVEIQEVNDEQYKKELWITKNPALCIEEEDIDFKDVIFEWVVPEKDELNSMFLSIIWWDPEFSGCDSHCSTCWVWWCGI
jgi:hypothetical protein